MAAPCSPTGRINLKELSPQAFDSEILPVMALLGQPSYRLKQIKDWLFKKGVEDFSRMTNFPNALADLLAEKYAVSTLQKAEEKTSGDGSKKIVWRLQDGLQVESVSLPTGKGVTFCISTQAGCPMGCVFCATGRGGYHRNLTRGEMIDQVLFLWRDEGAGTVPNIVFMGMGEPFLNFSNLLDALEMITREDFIGIGERRVTVSTIGIPQRIREFADLNMKVRLAVSLNAPTQRQRSALMPGTSPYPLKELLSAVVYYYRKTGIRVSLEYVVIPGVNASAQHISRLSRLIRGLPAKVNCIPYNQTSQTIRPEGRGETTEQFAAMLREKISLRVTVRKSLGADIEAACGQLAVKT